MVDVRVDHASPNHGDRREAARPDLVVVHHTAMATFEAACERLCDRASGVSAHYLIAEDGTVFRLVAEAARAWHAGAGGWGAVCDVNSRSIGIELANPGDRPYPARQMAALRDLIAAIRGRWAIPACRVIAHSDMAPSRKIDPGPRFDWRGLALAGQAVWSDAAAGTPTAAPDPAVLARALRRIGYPEAPEADVLRAFRLRFRPWGRGGPCAEDLARAEDLAARFPVDATAPGP